MVHVFKDEEYEAAGANLMPEGSRVHVQKDNRIVRPDFAITTPSPAPLEYAYVHFDHCYK